MDRTFDRSLGRHVLFILVFLLCLVPIASYAQEAGFIGRVTDESGAVLPGVTVTATSPALQVKEVSEVTNESGEYRLSALPIGTYALEFMLQGFQGVRRQELRLTIGFTAKVDVVLKVGALEETVTVSGEAPVVDVTSTTARTQLTRETLELIPTGRNSIVAVMIQAPGARPQLDWSFTTGNPFFKVFGQLGEEWVAMEGVVTSGPKTGTQGGNHYDYSAIEETTVTTVGNTADAPTKGIQINVLLKSGGNDFHGMGSFGGTGHRFESDNVNDALRARGVTGGNQVNSTSDLSGELGGRIIRDKLWFYYSTRRRQEHVQTFNAFHDDGVTPSVTDQFQYFHTGKMSYQMTPANKLIGFIQYVRQGGEGTNNQFSSYDSRIYSPTQATTSKIEWQAAKGNKFVSLQTGAWIWNVSRQCYSNDVSTTDQLTTRTTGCTNNYGIDSFEGRNHTIGRMTWYKPNLFAGNHDFKVGFDYAAAHADRRISSRDGTKNKATGLPTGPVGNYQLVYRTPPGATELVPFSMDAYNNCYKDGSPDCVPKDLTHTTWLYAQDSWTIARRLTLNLGARFAHAVGFIPAQCRSASEPPLQTVYPAKCWDRIDFPTWNSLVPRLHAAYDLSGDGKTLIKGGWGRFAHNWHSDELQMANENVHLVSRFLWHDLNNNKLFNPGEIDFNLNGPDFVSTSLFTGGEDGLAGAVPNPNLKEPMSNEYSLSLERQLMQNFAIRATGIYSRQQTFRVQNNLRPYGSYNTPISNPDPGPDGTVGTADDPGKSITFYEYPTALGGRQFQQPMLVNSPADDQKFTSFEVAASKRFDQRWTLMASYSATKIDIPHWQNTASTGNDFTNPGLQVFLATYDPNAEINSAYKVWEQTGRIDGAYIFPHYVQVSANFEHRSGQPYARTVNFRGPQPIPTIVLRVEPIGARRLPDINLLHMRFEKSFRMAQGRRLALQLNMFNVTNSNTEQSITQLSGVNFGRPGGVLSPRIVAAAVEYRF
jgi:hypothetical protein